MNYRIKEIEKIISRNIDKINEINNKINEIDDNDNDQINIGIEIMYNLIIENKKLSLEKLKLLKNNDY